MRWTIPLAVAAWASLCAPPAMAQDSAEQRYAQLVAEYDEAVAAYRARLAVITRSAEYREAREARDFEKLTQLRQTVEPVDGEHFAVAFLEAAREFAAEGQDVQFLLWVVQHGRETGQRAVAALDTLLDQHARSDALLPLVENNPYLLTSYAGLPGETGSAALDVLAESPHDAVRMHALYARGKHLERSDASDAGKARAAADIAAARELAEGTLLAARIDAPQFEKERLQLGMIAPDIVGEDVDGVEFRLSDYRGKVVVLDFWGDW